MNKRSSKFLSMAKHAFDLKAIHQTQQAVNSLLNAQVVVGKNPQAHYSDSNVLYEIPASPDVPETFFPFKIYKPKKEWLATEGITFDINGVPTAIAINPSAPTSLPTTINPNTDMWRIWAVRDGLCGVRSSEYVSFDYQFWLPNAAGTTIGADFSVLLELGAIGSGGDSINVENGLPYDANPDDYPKAKVTPIVLPASFTPFINSDPSAVCGFAISIETGEDATRLLGRTFNEITDYASVFNTDGSFGSYPGEPSVLVPIGVISTLGYDFFNGNTNTSGLTAFNLQFGHIQNRYGMYENNYGNQNTVDLVLFLTQNYRGNFLTDSGIENVAFYPGDTVLNEVEFDFSSGTPAKLYAQNLYMMTQVGFTADPTTDPDWILLSGVSSTSVTAPTPNT